MDDLITIKQTDSTNDGSGASSTLEPPQVDNAVDNAIIIKVTQSKNGSDMTSATMTTPAGYTYLTDLRDSELRSWVFYKQSTGSESIPTVSSSVTAEWTCTTVIITDVDWINGGVAQFAQSVGGGDHQSPSLTTDSSGNASAIVCLYSLERRTLAGFRYPDSLPTTFYSGTVSTGASEGDSNAGGAGYDFLTDRSTSWTGPFWEASSGGDSVAINIEIIVNGNIRPLQSVTYVSQPAPSNTMQTNMDWCRKIVASGKGLDDNTLEVWSFDASSDINTSTNEITLTAHNMVESMVLYFSDGGNTAPTGLSNDTFYYAFPQDANTIKLCTMNEDSDSTTDLYYQSTTQRPIASITGTGTGSVTLTEARMINAGISPLSIIRPAGGSLSNQGPASNGYIGDAGYNQNYISTAQGFDSLFDANGSIISFPFTAVTVGRIATIQVTFIDEDGDWVSFKIYQSLVSPAGVGLLTYQFQIDESDVISLACASFGTFDATKINYMVISARGNNTSHGRYSSLYTDLAEISLGGTFTVVGGEEASLSELVSLANSYTSSISQPSSLQVTSTAPISIGNGTQKVSFIDSEKSIAFPELANGVDSFQDYLTSIGISINATSDSVVKLKNTQIGASAPYNLNVSAIAGSDVDLTGNSYVFGNATLDNDVLYDRQLFVGGEGVTDNGSTIRNSTFIVNDQLGTDSGIINLNSSTDIESSTFDLSTGTTTGHALKILTAGTYTFTDLDFNGFGADASSTSAVFNDSGGAVILIIDGGDSPTVRNGAGASTTVQAPAQTIEVLNIEANSRIQIYNETMSTEVANEIVTGSSYTGTYTEGGDFTAGEIVRVRLTYQSGTTAKLGYEATAIAGLSGWSLLANQEDDSIYNTIATDGSTITNFSADYVNSEVDIILGADYLGHDLYARFVYFITTEDGIRNFFGAVRAIDMANFENDVSILDLFLNNNTATNVVQLDNIRWFKSNGVYPVRNPTTGGGGVDIVWRDKVFIAETGASGLTASESTQLFGTALEASLDVVNRGVKKASKLIPHNIDIEAQAPSAWTPADFTGNMVSWTDPSDLSSIDQTANAVSELRDQQAGIDPFVQATASAQPITGAESVKGLNLIKYDGSLDSLGRSNPLTEMRNNTAFIVIKHRASNAGIVISYTGSTSSPVRWDFMAHFNNTDIIFTAGNNTSQIRIPTVLNVGETYLFSMISEVTTGNSQLYMNNILIGSNTPTVGQSPNTITLGATSSVTGFKNVSIGENILVEGVLPPTDFAKFNTYLMDKWIIGQ